MTDKVEIRLGVSTRALFDLEKENDIFDNKGLEEYIKYNERNENKILKTGVAFRLVKNMLALNDNNNVSIKVILMSRANAQIATRIFRSIEYYGIAVEEAFFTGGESLTKYVQNSNIDLYLSASETDVKSVLDAGIAAGCIKSGGANYNSDDNGLRVAFDCDRVLFSDESDRVFESKGLEYYEHSEKRKAHKPIEPGPFKNFLVKLGKIQEQFGYSNDNPIQIAICTARSYNVHERALKTIKSWGVRVNQAFFLAGNNKAIALEAFNADIFFDDGVKNIENASGVVPSCHVIT